MSDLKKSTKKALVWSALDKVGQQLVTALTAVFTARLLSADDFGIMAVLFIFPALSNILLDGGLMVALVRKTDADQDDFNTMFWFNLVIGGVLYLLLWTAAPLIPRIYGDAGEGLVPLARWLFLTIVIYATGLIQVTVLVKRMDFKKLGVANIASLLCGGVVAVALAWNGFGVWALVAQALVAAVVKTVFFWLFGRWKPALRFRMASFRKLFGFSSKLIVGSLVNTVSMYIYAPILRKYYSFGEIGYYTQANKMKEMGSSVIWTAFGLSTYSMMANLQHDKQQLKHAMRKTIRTVAFVAFPILIGIAVLSPPLISILVTDRWLPSVPFLYPLCVGAIFFILNYINGNVIKVCGRSDLSLRMDILTAGLLLLFLMMTLKYGILVAVVADTVSKMIVYGFYMGVTNRIMGYSPLEQLKDIAPYAVLALAAAVLVYPIHWFITRNFVLLIVQGTVAAGFYLGVARWTGSKIMDEVTGMIINSLRGNKTPVDETE